MKPRNIESNLLASRTNEAIANDLILFIGHHGEKSVDDIEEIAQIILKEVTLLRRGKEKAH